MTWTDLDIRQSRLDKARAYWNGFDKCHICRALPGMSCREVGSSWGSKRYFLRSAHGGRPTK